jgi:2Fe-2S ferredoxin
MATKVSILPGNLEFEAKAGETLMEAAHAHGFYWPTTCGGQGICTTCLSEVVSDDEALVEMGRSERKTLVAERGEAILRRPVRLACQAACSGKGAVTVNKLGVRSADEA